MASTAASSPTRVATATRAAGAVYVATGVGFGVGAVISLVYLAERRAADDAVRVPGFERTVRGARNRMAQCLRLGLRRCLRHRDSDRMEVVEGLGFALPFYLASIPIRLGLLALARRTQH